MKKYEINNENVYFHEEAHLYFGSEEDLNKFSASYSKNPDWAIRNKSRWNPVRSITQYLGEAFPFSGGDLKITKAWFKKEAMYKGEQDTWIEERVKQMEDIETYLSESVKRSQDEGNVGHESIQDFIENYIKTGKAQFVANDNPYWNSFLQDVSREDSHLKEFIKNIEVVLPSEIPIIGRIGDSDVVYAGKWDLLVKMKDGRVILIDIKTGSNLKEDKAIKVGLQLNAYQNLVESSLDVKVDELLCWEFSYKIPYNEVLSKFKAEKRKVDKSAITGKEVPLDTLKRLEEQVKTLESNKGYREYYFKEHKYKQSNHWQDIMISVDRTLKAKSLAKEDMKEKK